MADADERVADRLAFLRVHLHDGVPLASAARDAGVPIRTARRWLARFRDAGPAGLALKPRSDAGGRKLARDLVELIEGLAFTKPRLSAATIYRRVRAVSHERGLRAPSYGTVHAIMAGLDPAALTLAHDGEAAFRDKYELAHRHRAERPNATWQADLTELDILILDANGKEARPWLTTVIDDHSRAVAGYMVFLGPPSALNTSLALRQAIWCKARPDWQACGIPDVLYVDHGSDFTSLHLEQAAADLRIRLIFSAVAPAAGARQGGAVVRHHQHGAAARAAGGLARRRAGVAAAAVARQVGRCGRGVRGGRVQPAHPPRNRRGADRRLAGERLAAPDARNAGGAGHASGYGGQAQDRSPRRHTVPRSALLRPHARGVCRRARHHPLRPPRHGARCACSTATRSSAARSAPSRRGGRSR